MFSWPPACLPVSFPEIRENTQIDNTYTTHVLLCQLCYWQAAHVLLPYGRQGAGHTRHTHEGFSYARQRPPTSHMLHAWQWHAQVAAAAINAQKARLCTKSHFHCMCRAMGSAGCPSLSERDEDRHIEYTTQSLFSCQFFRHVVGAAAIITH